MTASASVPVCDSRFRAPLQADFFISREMPHEAAAREALLDRAMGPLRKRKASERLRRGRVPAIALAARDTDGALCGTVRLWPIEAGGRPALLLGPLAVDPASEGQGIGSALMRQAIAQAAISGHGAIILVGDPEYYSRFGFSAERTGLLAMPGPFEKRRLLALELVEGALDGARGVLMANGRRKGGRAHAANAA